MRVSRRGRVARLVAVQLSVFGLYLPPVFVSLNVSSTPPQTIISLFVHTVVCAIRPSGALVVFVTRPSIVGRIISAAGL